MSLPTTLALPDVQSPTQGTPHTWQMIPGAPLETPAYQTGCFGHVQWGRFPKIRAMVRLSPPLTRKAAETWVRFVEGCLEGGPLNYRVGHVLAGSSAIPALMFSVWTKDGSLLQKPKGLLYCTMFRYVGEYPDFVMAFHKHGRRLGLSKQWDLFMRLHWDAYVHTGSPKPYGSYYVNGSHGLVSSHRKTEYEIGTYELKYTEQASDLMIDLKTFRAKLANPKVANVNDHFRKASGASD